MVEFLFLFGHVFWLTDCGSRTIEKKKMMMMMMEKISAIQREHATTTRPGQTRWEEMSMSMMKLISMMMVMKIKDDNNHNHPKYQSHLTQGNFIIIIIISSLSLSLSLSEYQPTELITPAVQQNYINYLPSRNKRYFSRYTK